MFVCLQKDAQTMLWHHKAGLYSLCWSPTCGFRLAQRVQLAAYHCLGIFLETNKHQSLTRLRCPRRKGGKSCINKMLWLLHATNTVFGDTQVPACFRSYNWLLSKDVHAPVSALGAWKAEMSRKRAPPDPVRGSVLCYASLSPCFLKFQQSIPWIPWNLSLRYILFH